MRAKRNKKVNEKLDIYGKKNDIIDSAQVVGASIILKYLRKIIDRTRARLKAEKEAEEEEKELAQQIRAEEKDLDEEEEILASAAHAQATIRKNNEAAWVNQAQGTGGYNSKTK